MVVSDVSRKIKIKRGQIFINFGFEKIFILMVYHRQRSYIGLE